MDRYRVRLPDGAMTEITCDAIRRSNGSTFEFDLNGKLVAVIPPFSAITLIDEAFGNAVPIAVSATFIPKWTVESAPADEAPRRGRPPKAQSND